MNNAPTDSEALAGIRKGVEAGLYTVYTPGEFELADLLADILGADGSPEPACQDQN